MSKVLIFGVSPLPIENEKKITGPGIRTWQFTKSLLDDTHKIRLICLQDQGAYFKDNPKLFRKEKNFEYYSFPCEKFRNLRFIQGLARNFKPDCIISNSTFWVSKIAAEIGILKPIWFDRGDLMAEAQLKSHNDKDDTILKQFFQLEKSVLGRADIFSTVSFPQKCSLIGRLGGAGRLNMHTLGYEFVHVIHCGIDSNEIKKTNTILRGKLVENNDFIILWSGGYNTWTDVDTLFKGIESAMRQNDRIKFVSTGGPLDGQDNFTYQRFIEFINKSRFKKRFIMLGWIANNCLADIYLESNLAVNIDKNCYETLLGSRHRLLDWMRAGLPFITTTPSEFTQSLCNKELAFPFNLGDRHSLTTTILKLSKSRGCLQNYSSRIKRFVTKDCSFKNTTPELRAWVKKPVFAPDKFIMGKKNKKLILMNNVDSFDTWDLKNLNQHASNLEAIRTELTKQINQLNEHVANLERNQNNLKVQNTGLELANVNLTKHASNLEAIRTELTKQINQLNEHVANLERNQNNLKVQNTGLELANVNLTKHASNLEAIRTELTKQINQLNEHVANLERNQNNLKVQNTGLELANVNLTKHASNLEAIRTELTKQIDYLNEQLAVSIKQVEKLDRENKILKVEINEAQNKLNIANVSIAKLQEDNSKIKNELSSCKDELNRIHKTLIYRAYFKTRNILSKIIKTTKVL